MTKTTAATIQRSLFIICLFLLFYAGTCNRGYKRILEEKKKEEAEAAKKKAEGEHTRNLLKLIKGIHYTEVKRVFDNGMTFSPVGYQLVPEWRISFPSVDSVNIFSPKLNKFLNAPVMFDHDSIFNVAWAWLKLRYIKKDSLQFMVLHVHDDTIVNEKVHVFMTFYTNSYIKDVLHSDTLNLWRPSRSDTNYIRKKVAWANSIPDSAFAGTDPPVLKSRSPLVTVRKKPVEDAVDGGKSYDAYLSPTYDITIHHAYQDFGYEYTAFVDEKGNITFRKSLEDLSMSQEFEDNIITAMKGITDSYLKLYVATTPAKTLGMPHKCIIFLNVSGYKK
jgi:hypothetical protein